MGLGRHKRDLFCIGLSVPRAKKKAQKVPLITPTLAIDLKTLSDSSFPLNV
jgi:hypothetical protein